MHRHRTINLFVCAIALGLCNSGGEASAGQRDPVQIVEDVSALPLGAPRKMVQKILRDRVRAEYRMRIKSEPDPTRRDSLKKEQLAAVRSIEKTYEEFTGKSGYDLSVLTGEFRHGAKDAVLREERGSTNRYYLFHNGRLWKVVATVDPFYDYGSTLLRLAARYGKPTTIEFGRGSPAMPPVSAVWRMPMEVLEAIDMRAEYGCYKLVWAKTSMWSERESDRRAVSGAALDPLIEEITSGSSSDEMSGIVDQILNDNAEPPAPR